GGAYRDVHTVLRDVDTNKFHGARGYFCSTVTRCAQQPNFANNTGSASAGTMQLFGFTAQNSTTPMLRLGLTGPRFLRATVPNLYSKTKKAARYKVSGYPLANRSLRTRARGFLKHET